MWFPLFSVLFAVSSPLISFIDLTSFVFQTSNRWERLAAKKFGAEKPQDSKSKVEFKRPALAATTNISANIISGTAKLSLKTQSEVALKQDVELKKVGSVSLHNGSLLQLLYSSLAASWFFDYSEAKSCQEKAER